MDKFQLVSDYKLSGDQPEAVDALVKGIESGMREQTLMGVTGSGKTFTMANVIARINRPTLAPNVTPASTDSRKSSVCSLTVKNASGSIFVSSII